MIYQYITLGGGNAGYSAAIAAKQAGVNRVLIIEKSAETTFPGGNTYFAPGMSLIYGLDDLLPILHDVDPETVKCIDMVPYKPEDYMTNLMRVTGGRADPALADVLVNESRETIDWLDMIGVKFRLSFNRQAYKVDGRYKFYAGQVLAIVDGGKGMVRQYIESANNHGVTVQYGTSLIRLLTHDQSNTVRGLEVLLHDGTKQIISAGSVVLACGGFEANPAMRAQYLGKTWDMAHVRGTPSCHATCRDVSTDPHCGDKVLTNQFTKNGYPLGIMVNRDGKRFVDEGKDYRNYTYACFGKEVMNQPGSVAFQIWDAKTLSWLREEEYGDSVVEKIVADSIEELADKAALANKQALVDTVQEYNDAVSAHRQQHPDLKWDPTTKDGLSTQCSKMRLQIPKSNWALPIDQAPFVAVKITTGITFTFGGLAVDPKTAAVLDGSSKSIGNLYAAGEIVGGVFYDNYPSGSGLMLGSILGRKAGTSAAVSHLNGVNV
ncbi:fumarate reductase flavoprotein subunit [Zychaea mexicana]|uniref:fumarate reductase flavoprotein subunit n=1 Tax=Zychaea mexicana TaxID=64656 RepID=UPI0022FE0E52|nr:fumarate reductase flavoprotein subunit [Zychaea mexicana]KAI9497605.1 fumarate reductase flavoprotein subunit [Zychaea mexicana]